MSDAAFQIAALIVPLIFAIVFHEVAHGYVAKLLGDPTAADLNRLSLNPMRHVDPVGTIILPGILALLKAPVFGWAKPVPVNKWRLRNPRTGMMLVAAAGPGTNLAMAGIGAVLLGLLARQYAGLEQPTGLAAFLALNLVYFVQFNVFLALFNLIPIPPFDGSHIVEGLLPRDLALAYAQLHRFGLILVILVLIVLPSFFPGFDPIGRYLLPPVRLLIEQYMALAAQIAGQKIV